MLFGWPVLGAIEKVKETTFTTVLTTFAQVIGLVILILAKEFHLANIAMLRNLTEMILLISRLYFCYKFRDCFVVEKMEKNND